MWQRWQSGRQSLLEQHPERSGGGGGYVAGESPARVRFTSAGTIPSVARDVEPTQRSASSLVYDAPASATPATPAYSGRNVLEQARSLVAASSELPLDERADVYRRQLRARARSPVFQAALMRAMGADERDALRRDSGNLDLDRMERDAASLSDAEQAAASWDTRWLNDFNAVWCEVYFATYVAKYGAADLKDRLGHVMAAAAGTVGRALGAAQRDGLISAATVLSITGSNFELEGAATFVLTEPVAELRERFDEAQAKLASLEHRLQQELQEFGPALYDPNEQDPAKLAEAGARVQAYIDHFRSSEEYRRAKAEAVAAARALGEEIGTFGDDMIAHGELAPAAGSEHGPRTMVLDTYEALAGSEDGALQAVEWAESHASDPSFSRAERERIAQISELGQNIDATAKMQTVQQLMQELMTEDDDVAKQSAFQSVLGFIDNNIIRTYGRIGTLRGMTELGRKFDELRRNTSIVMSLLSGNGANALEIATQFFAGAPARSATIVTRVWSGFGAMIGTYRSTRSLIEAPMDVMAFGAANSLYNNLVKLKTLANGVEGAATVDHQAQALGLIDNIKTGYGSLRSFGFGVLGIAGSLMSLDEQIERARAYPGNVALQIQLAANIASLVGSTLSLFPALAPLGSMISACASFVSMIAGFFVGDPEGDQRREEAREIMAQSDVLGDAELAGALTARHASGNVAAAQAGGMTTDQIHALALSRPWALSGEDYIDHIDALRQWLGRHPELGHYSTEPSLHELLTGLDRGSLDELEFHANLHFQAIKRDQPFMPSGEEWYVTNVVEMVMPQYYVRGDGR